MLFLEESRIWERNKNIFAKTRSRTKYVKKAIATPIYLFELFHWLFFVTAILPYNFFATSFLLENLENGNFKLDSTGIQTRQSEFRMECASQGKGPGTIQHDYKGPCYHYLIKYSKFMNDESISYLIINYSLHIF